MPPAGALPPGVDGTPASVPAAVKRASGLVLRGATLVDHVAIGLELAPSPTDEAKPEPLAAGIDPVYFGVLFIMNNAIGLITPPVGTVLNVVCGVARITMDDAFKGVMPFFLAQLAVLFLLVLHILDSRFGEPALDHTEYRAVVCQCGVDQVLMHRRG